MALLPYPSSFPQEALMMMLDKFRGNEVNTPDLINAAWNVVGYGLGQTMGGGKIVAGDVPEDASDADIIASVLKQYGSLDNGPENTVTFTFIPWIVVAKVAIKLIVKLLA